MDDVSKAIGEMTAEVRNVGTRLDRLEATLLGQHQVLEQRVKALELWRSFLTGGFAVVSAAVGWLFAK